MLAQLLALEKPAPPALRHALVGGAALSTDLARRAETAGWPIQPTYGMSETCRADRDPAAPAAPTGTQDASVAPSKARRSR